MNVIFCKDIIRIQPEKEDDINSVPQLRTCGCDDSCPGGQCGDCNTTPQTIVLEQK